MTLKILIFLLVKINLKNFSMIIMIKEILIINVLREIFFLKIIDLILLELCKGIDLIMIEIIQMKLIAHNSVMYPILIEDNSRIKIKIILHKILMDLEKINMAMINLLVVIDLFLDKTIEIKEVIMIIH